MKNSLRLLAVVLLFTAGLGVLAAQDHKQPTMPETAVAAAQQQNDMQAQEAKPFTGTIVKEKGKLVLKDSSTNMSYQLDDQDKAKQFEGKEVKVTGKLDANTKMIHVENIEAGS